MRSLTMAILKSLSFTESYSLTFMLLQICFIFREIHGEGSNKYSRIQVSANCKVIKLNWVGISRTHGKTRFKQNKNNMGLNELMRMIIILWFLFETLLIFKNVFIFPDLRETLPLLSYQQRWLIYLFLPSWSLYNS